MNPPEPPFDGWRLWVVLLGLLGLALIGVGILSAAGLLGFLVLESFRYL